MRTAEELMNSILDYEEDAELIKQIKGKDDPDRKAYLIQADLLREELEDRFGITQF